MSPLEHDRKAYEIELALLKVKGVRTLPCGCVVTPQRLDARRPDWMAVGLTDAQSCERHRALPPTQIAGTWIVSSDGRFVTKKEHDRNIFSSPMIQLNPWQKKLTLKI